MTPLEVVVRAAVESDLEALSTLRATWTGEGAPDPDFARRMAAWHASERDRRTTWLALSGDLVLGMAGLVEFRRMPRPGRADSRWGYVSSVFVLERFRRRGVGARLLQALIEAADERGYARLIVSPTAESIDFYRRGGFLVPASSADAETLLVRPGPAPSAAG